MKIGIISDTHGYWDPRIPDHFAGVEHILHAGDIGESGADFAKSAHFHHPWIIFQLRQIAPVTAVLGNTDVALEFRETEIVPLAGRKFLVHHIVDVAANDGAIHQRIHREHPDVVVFGHTHRPFCQTIGRTLYVNPGYAGKKRFNLARSVAVLKCDDSGVAVEFKDL